MSNRSASRKSSTSGGHCRALPFHGDCVSWDRDDVDAPGGLVDMIDASREITRRTFLSHVDRDALRDIEACLGYARHPRNGLTIKADYHVRYARSVLHGRPAYYLIHSAIEYVFSDQTPRSA